MTIIDRLDLLLIDDAEDDRTAYCDVLTQAGFSVRQFDNPWSAYQRAVTDPPALIVADICMPGPLDGIELTRKLKANRATRTVPIIVLTAYATEETRAEALRAGAAIFLLKPCAPDALLAEINRLLASSDGVATTGQADPSSRA